MLLPHGYDGAGPEHSSSKIERFLQLSDDGDVTPAHDVNLIVANPSTPAQLYHLLRRQVNRNFRKPLIVASPKGLLRSPVAASPLSDMGPGTKFQPVIADDVSSAKHIILCSGKHYYTLSEAIAKQGVEGTALVRVEELSPFPSAELEAVLSKSPSSAQVTWAQEEPGNQGAWTYVRPRLDCLLAKLGHGATGYAGRKAGATTATGVGAWHKAEAEAIVRDALA
jgi:probable 2-oxoglutarate dehydrogenase E1 component DHKTD1